MSKDKQGELFPDEEPKKKPSTNPRAQSARRKRARKKSDEANKSENERVLERAREEWEALNKQVEENRSKLRVPTIDPQDDWQTNPDFDREKGGWAPDPSQGVAGDAFTVWDALSITKAPLRGAASLLIKAPNMLKGAKKWYNKGRTPAEDKMSWRDLLIDDWKQRGKPGDGTKGGWDPTRGFRPGVKASEGGFGSGPTPLIRQVVERGLKNRLKVKPDDLGI